MSPRPDHAVLGAAPSALSAVVFATPSAVSGAAPSAPSAVVFATPSTVTYEEEAEWEDDTHPSSSSSASFFGSSTSYSFSTAIENALN